MGFLEQIGFRISHFRSSADRIGFRIAYCEEGNRTRLNQIAPDFGSNQTNLKSHATLVRSIDPRRVSKDDDEG